MRNRFISAALITRCAFALSGSLSLSATAAMWYVDASKGRDDNPGTSVERPFRSIRRAVSEFALGPGDTVLVRGGTYREQFSVPPGGLAPQKSVTISAYPGEHPIIKGSEVVTTQWEPWPSKTKLPIYVTTLNLPKPTQMVFVDEQPLAQIGKFLYEGPGRTIDSCTNHQPVWPNTWPNLLTATGTGPSDLTTNSFYYDILTHRLFVWLADGSNPAQHTIEAAQRTWSVDLNDSDAFDGFQVSHCQMDPCEHWSGLKASANNVALRNCTFSWNDFAGAIVQGTNCLITNCTFAYNGCDGFSGGYLRNLVFEGNDVHHNNTRHYGGGWADAGVKVTQTVDSQFLDNHFHDQNDIGLWMDVSCRNILVGNNRFNRLRTGAFFEISRWARILNNVATHCVAGYWSHSSDVLIAHNVADRCNYGVVVTGNPRAAEYGVDPDEIGHDCLAAVRNNVVLNNLIIDSTDSAVAIPPTTLDNYNNISDYNIFITRSGPGRSLAFMDSWGHFVRGFTNWQSLYQLETHSFVRPITDLTQPAGSNYAWLGQAPGKRAGIAIPEIIPDPCNSTAAPFAKTLAADSPESIPIINLLGVQEHYRTQPEPLGLTALPWPFKGTSVVGLNAAWIATPHSWPQFSVATNTSANPFVPDGLVMSDNLLADSDFDEQTPGPLKAPWMIRAGHASSNRNSVSISLSEKDRTGMVVQPVGKIGISNHFLLHYSLAATALQPGVTVTGQVYLAAGLNLRPLGDLAPGTISTDSLATNGWQKRTIVVSSGDTRPPAVGEDLFFVVRASATGNFPGENHPAGTFSIAHCLLSRAPEFSLLRDGDLRGQTRELAWQEPWRDGGQDQTWPRDGVGHLFVTANATNVWCYQDLGTVDLAHDYSTAVDCTVHNFNTNVITSARISLASGPAPGASTELAGDSIRVQLLSAVDRPTRSAILRCTYQARPNGTAPPSAHLYLIISAAGNFLNAPAASGPLGEVIFTHARVSRE